MLFGQPWHFSIVYIQNGGSPSTGRDFTVIFAQLENRSDDYCLCDPFECDSWDPPLEVFPPLLSPFFFAGPSPSISVDDDDLTCLMSHEWINDQVLNSYISLLVSQSPANVGYTNSFFYPKLKRDGPEAAACWCGIKGTPIRRFDIFMIPICVDDHWILVAVNFMSGRICIYDSFRGEFPEFADTINRFLAFQGGSQLPVVYTDVPEQTNGYDCGVFVMMFARCICFGAALDSFAQSDMDTIREEIYAELQDAIETQ
jgi:Ulp1 family protease